MGPKTTEATDEHVVDLNCPFCRKQHHHGGGTEETDERVIDLMTTEETAALFKVPIQTLRHWIATGVAPPSAKIGRRRMFQRADCEKFVRVKFAESANGTRSDPAA